MAFEQDLDEHSSHLELDLQPYVTGLNAFSWPPADNVYEASPPVTTFGVVPMSTAGNWPGTSLLQQPEYHLASYGASGDLLMWAEKQLLNESQKGESFEDAITAFIFALRDTPLQNGRATITGPANLVRSVCDMVSWMRIWQASNIYVHGVDVESGLPTVHPLPETTTWELKSQAITAVKLSEHTALFTLDEMLKETNRVEKLPMWACLRQLLLIYRKLHFVYTEIDRPPCDPGRACLSSTAMTVKQIYHLLLVKYAAYFDSSSPIYPKKDQEPTIDLLAGDARIQTAWENVMQRRQGFCESSTQEVARLLLLPWCYSRRQDPASHVYRLRLVQC